MPTASRPRPWRRSCSVWPKLGSCCRSMAPTAATRWHARPHTISAFEVIQAIDGPLFITSCVTVRGECDQSDRCNIREPLRKVNESIEAVLKRIKISHMREEPEEIQHRALKPADLVTIS